MLCSHTSLRLSSHTALRQSIKVAWQVEHAISQALKAAWQVQPAKLSLLQAFRTRHAKANQHRRSRKNGTPLCRLPLQPQSTTNRSKAEYQGGMASEACCQPSSHCCKLSEPAMQKQISTAGPGKTAHHSAAFLCSRKAQQTALRLSIKAACQVKHAASQALTVASFQNPPCKSKSAPQVQEKRHTTLPPSFAAAKHNKPL